MWLIKWSPFKERKPNRWCFGTHNNEKAQFKTIPTNMKFLNFPAKISPRMSVEGEEWFQPELPPTSPTSPSSLLTRDTSNPICQHSQKFLQSHIFPGSATNGHLMSNVTIPPLRKYIFVCQTISHRGNIGFKKLSETFNDENLSWILLEDFAPRSVIAWQIDAGNVIWVEYFQTTNNQLCTCLTWHTCQRVSAL